MSKITRRSYKRKKIIMGAALFGAVGLVSTGFAAWVLSASATQAQGATLNVGTVDKKNMEFQNVKVYGLDTSSVATKDTEVELVAPTFSFNPRVDDTTGRVRFGRGAGSDIGERLSLTIRGEVTHAQNMGTLTIHAASYPAALDDAVTAGYIKEIPSWLQDTPVEIPVGTSGNHYALSGTDDKTAAFQYTVAFEWGSAFGNTNPADFYETNVETVSIDDVETTLTAMHTLLDTVAIEVTLTANPS